MRDIEQNAREQLAEGLRASYPDDIARRHVIRQLLADELDLINARVAVRTLAAALTPPESCALAAAARGSLPFIAYAFAQGVDGAEEAGRAIEAALETNEPDTYVQVPVELLRIVIGCAYPVSTEIDPRGYRWSEAYLDQALPHVKAALLAARLEVTGG